MATNSNNIDAKAFVLTVVLKLECAKELPRGLVKTQMARPHPFMILIQKVWVGAQEFAFLTGSQVVLLLLALGPQTTTDLGIQTPNYSSWAGEDCSLVMDQSEGSDEGLNLSSVGNASKATIPVAQH